MKFKASLDNLAKVVTIVVSVLFTVIIIGQLMLIQDLDKSTSYFTIFILIVVYMLVFLYRPLSYILTADTLLIHRAINDVKIELKEIINVELIDKERLKGTIRTFGVGGLFGYWGRFVNRKIGMMIWYATRRENAILITTISNKKIVITPDDPILFVSFFMNK